VKEDKMDWIQRMLSGNKKHMKNFGWKVSWEEFTSELSYSIPRFSPSFFLAGKVTDTDDGVRVLDASTHLLPRVLVSQSASESWCIKYAVTSSVNQTPFVHKSISLCATRLRSYIAKAIYDYFCFVAWIPIILKSDHYAAPQR
jgi:hypothetical protein